MTGPVLIASDAQYSPGADLSTLTSSAATIATSNGDVIVVKAATWDTGTSMSTPSGGGQTFQAVQIAAPGVFAGWSGTWVCTVAGSPGTFSVSSTPSLSSRHSMVVERWGSAFVDPTPASFPSNHGTGATMVAPFVTSAANSVISFAMTEEQSRDPSGRTWSPVTVVETGLYDGHSGSNSVQYFAYVPVPSAGATTIGLTVPAGSLNWTISGVEIKAAAGPVIVDMSATLAGAGTLSAGLVREAPVAATLTGAGSLTDGLTREVALSAGLTATGSLSATLSVAPKTVSLSANFSATGSMTAVFSLPTIGPTDPIGVPVAEELMACFMEQLATLPVPPRYIQLRVGSETGPLIGPNIDECCAGLAWIRVANLYPSWDSFPAADNTWLPCGPLAYAVVLEMGVTFCMPWSDSDESIDNIDPPSTEDWATAFQTQMVHQTLMRRTAACCFRPTQRRAVGEWTPLPVEGGCTGGKLLVTVSVPAPCADC